MNTETKPTPTPWTHGDASIGAITTWVRIIEGDRLIGRLEISRKGAFEEKEGWSDYAKQKDLLMQDAELIVRAVNSHVAMLESCKAALDPDPCELDDNGYCQSHGLNDPCPQKLLRDAIALAEGKP